MLGAPRRDATEGRGGDDVGTVLKVRTCIMISSLNNCCVISIISQRLAIRCQGDDWTKDFSGMHLNQDEPDLSSQEYSDIPRKTTKPNSGSYLQTRRRSLQFNLGAYSYLPRLPPKSAVQIPTNQPESPTSIRQSILSSSLSKSSLPSHHLLRAYAGPQPTGPEGRPLRSCVKKPKIIDFQINSVRRKVSFDHVDLRDYRRIAGDNPSVTDGCPLAIGWEYNCQGKVDINTYEGNRADRSKDNAQYGARGLSPLARKTILMVLGGVPRAEIAQSEAQAYLHKRLRLDTLDQIGGVKNCQFVGPVERLIMMKESAARKLERAKTGISPAQEQLKLWEDAHKAAMKRKLREEAKLLATRRFEQMRRSTM